MTSGEHSSKYGAFLKKVWLGLGESLSRFLGAAVLSVLLFAAATADTFNLIDGDVLLPALGFGMVLAAGLRVLTERKLPRFNKSWIPLAVALPVSFACALLLNAEATAAYTVMVLLGLTAAIVAGTVWLLCTGQNQHTLFAYFIEKGVFSLAASLLLLAGLELCLLAVDLLLTPISAGNLWEIAPYLVLLVLLPNLFLSFVPKDDAPQPVSRVYRTLLCYVALPVYLLLLAVLYGYLVKILFAWSLPSGELNPFASGALLGFVCLWLGLRSFEQRPVRLFVRWGGLLLLPIVAAQAVAVAVRINAYGLTTARYVSIVCTLVGIAAIVLALLQKGLRPFCTVVVAASLLLSITPLNALDVPVRSQQARLARLLTEYGMYDGTRITASETLSDDAKKAIHGSYLYLQQTQGRLSAFGTLATGDGAKAIKESTGAHGADETVTVSVFRTEASSYAVPVDGYRRCCPIEHWSRGALSETGDLSVSDGFTMTLPVSGSETRTLDLRPSIERFIAENLPAVPVDDMLRFDAELDWYPAPDVKIYVTALHLFFQDGALESVTMAGYALLR